MGGTKRLGNQTVKHELPPSILSFYSIVGKKEKEGPLGSYFDLAVEDPLWNEKTWEQAETKFVREAVQNAINKSGIGIENINYILSGDLINQCTCSSFGLKDYNIPYFGIYGACSTMAESLSLGSMLVDGGYADYCVASTSSHFCSAEKQFRFPLEYGGQRPPTSQWTVTGSGAVVLSSTGTGPYITHVTTGKMIDYEIKDANNMGAAMAPAAVDTIFNHFTETKLTPDYYDLIITGDLGEVGKEIVLEMLYSKGLDLYKNFTDCGVEIFDNKTQDTHAGGSGCGCSAVVLCGYILPEIIKGSLQKVLFISTGALLSPLTTQQKQTIPSIAHAVTINRQME